MEDQQDQDRNRDQEHLQIARRLLPEPPNGYPDLLRFRIGIDGNGIRLRLHERLKRFRLDRLEC